MIEIKKATKSFGKFKAIDDADCEISDGSVFGLVGSNGAGKSTLLRLIAGVFKQDAGSVTIDEQEVYDNVLTKKQCVFLSDNPHIPFGATLNKMSNTSRLFYDDFSQQEYSRLVNLFNLDPNKQLADFSKGMRRQAIIILALSCMSKYIIMDETLDGLDPVIRALVKRLLYQAVIDRGATVIISSHSLRELEDLCDNLAMIHNGKIIFQRDIENISSTVSKVQVVMDADLKKQDFKDIDVLSYTRKGSVSNLIVKGKSDEVISILQEKEPLLLEVLPLTLEEIFIYELKNKGYSFDEILQNGGERYEK